MDRQGWMVIAVALAACSKAPEPRSAPSSPPTQTTRAEAPAAAPADAPAPVDAPAPADAPVPAAPALAAWRVSLAEAEHLEVISHPAIQVHGGFEWASAEHERVNAELAARVAELPDDSPDLPEAACSIARDHRQDRSAVEAQLRRAIAVVRARPNGQASQLYGSLHRSYLNIDPGARWRDGKLEWTATDGVIGGFVLWDCSRADVGALRVRLADVYSSEARYPKDPFTKQPYPGKPTSKQGRRGSALAELEALYREVSAARDDAAAATVLELASRVFCEPASRSSVCLERVASAQRAVALRERALRADDPALADALVLRARLVVERDGAKADADYRRVLAQAAPSAEARLHAATDLGARLRARGDVAGARALEAAFIADLDRATGHGTWIWSELAGIWADIVSAEGRAEVGVRILAAAVRAIQRTPSCARPEKCVERLYVAGLLKQQAALDPAAAPGLLRQAAEHERVEAEQRARHVAEVVRRMRPAP